MPRDNFTTADIIFYYFITVYDSLTGTAEWPCSKFRASFREDIGIARSAEDADRRQLDGSTAWELEIQFLRILIYSQGTRQESEKLIKKNLRRLFPVLTIGVGLSLALCTAALNSIDFPTSLKTTAEPPVPSFTPTPQGISHPGSTDGIMLMGLVIVLIIVLPIIFRRSTWTR